jgi:hypothetical protein
MQLRAMIRENGKWQKELPEDLLRWMWKHDGEEALIIDDSTEPKTYYVGNTELLKACQAEGKTAFGFYELSRKLWDEKQDEEWAGKPVSQ